MNELITPAPECLNENLSRIEVLSHDNSKTLSDAVTRLKRKLDELFGVEPNEGSTGIDVDPVYWIDKVQRSLTDTSTLIAELQTQLDRL